MILNAEIDEAAFNSEEPWASFLISEPERTTKCKGRSKVAVRRGNKAQAKGKGAA